MTLALFLSLLAQSKIISLVKRNQLTHKFYYYSYVRKILDIMLLDVEACVSHVRICFWKNLKRFFSLNHGFNSMVTTKTRSNIDCICVSLFFPTPTFNYNGNCLWHRSKKMQAPNGSGCLLGFFSSLLASLSSFHLSIHEKPPEAMLIYPFF